VTGGQIVASMKAFKTMVLLAGLCALVAGCGKASPGQTSDEKPQLHKDVPPHGGTPIPLGDDYNLELVRDPGNGILSGYVLDDEMEDFIRSSSSSITIVAKFGGQTRTLVLGAVANPATGETVGDTSLFQGQADWLKATSSFDGNLSSLTIRKTTFTDVSFSFPKNGGN
jgi:hypothetical protein